jgi:hypothetical protein
VPASSSSSSSTSSPPQSPGINADDFEWSKVTVEKYNETANKWRIKEQKSGAIYEVPRIYLMLSVEKPFMFAQRIQRATQLRYECETRLRFEAAVDGIALSEMPKPSLRLQEGVRRLCRRFAFRWVEIFEREYCMDFQKTLAALELIKLVEGEPHSFPSIQLPTKQTRLKNPMMRSNKADGNSDWRRRQKTLEESRRTLQKTWLLCCPRAIKIMEFISSECEAVARMSLFHISDAASDLTEFTAANRRKLSEMSKFLGAVWVEEVLVGELTCQLDDIGRGWFDRRVNDWCVYRSSKLRRLIEFSNHRMELAVRVMLRSSLRAFVNHLCQPCESTLSMVASVDFVWGNDLLSSRFHSPQPVFALRLYLDAEGEPKYSANPNEFASEIIETSTSTIYVTHSVPHIDSYLVPGLMFDEKLRLSSLGLLDEEIQAQFRHVERCYSSCEKPLRAFAQEFTRFKDLRNLIIPEFVRTFRQKSECKTAKEVEKEISFQLKAIEEIELTVPLTLVIGPFQVDIGGLKEELIVKRRDMYRQLLRTFVEIVSEKLEAVEGGFKEITAKLSMKSDTIEELIETRQWVVDVPEEVAELQRRLKDMSGDFEVLEKFQVALPDDSLRIKISSMTMPREIEKKIVRAQQVSAAGTALGAFTHDSLSPPHTATSL